MKKSPRFLTIDEIAEIHATQIRQSGGAGDLRDAAALESVTEAPRATFDGQFLNRNVYEMAAAYLLGIVVNHPFLDGNKRAGAASAFVFLFINGVMLNASESDFYKTVIAVARGQLQKRGIADFLRRNSFRFADFPFPGK